MLESAPPKPTLNVLIIEGEDSLKVPDSIIKQWYHDNRFGARFKAFLDTFALEFGKAPQIRSADTSVVGCLSNSDSLHDPRDSLRLTPP